MSSRPDRPNTDPTPPARQAAPPRAEQLIETHKAWIHAAAGMHSRHTRRRPRYLRPLAISGGIALAALLLVAVGRGGDVPRGTADFAGELIPVLGADRSGTGAKPVVHAFRGRRDRANEGRRGGGKTGGRSERAAAGPAAEPAARPEEALPEPRVPEAAPALTAAPAAAPQVADLRAAARPDSAAPDAQDP